MPSESAFAPAPGKGPPGAANGGRKTRLMRWARTPQLWVLPAITLAGLGLRIDLLFQPMRCDESDTFLNSASRPLRVLLSSYTSPNNHIFHTLLVHISVLIFGTEPWAIRLPALIAGTLIIPAVYLMAAEFFGTNVAIAASALAASSSILIEYSTNARGYTMLWVCFLLALLVAKRLTAGNSRAGWVLFSALCTAGFFTIPIMLFPFGVVLLWLFFDQLARSPGAERSQFCKYALLSVLLTGFLVLALYSPVLMAVGWRSVVANKFVTPNPWFRPLIVDSLRRTWALFNRDVPLPLRYGLEIGFALSLLNRAAAGDPLRLAAAVALWCPAVLILIRVVPFERVWLFLLPLYFVLGLQGWSFLGRWIPGRAIFLAPVLALGLGFYTISTGSILASVETGTLPDAERVAEFLKPRLGNSCRVLAELPSPIILDYYLKTPPHTVVVRTVGPADRCLFVVVNKTVSQSLSHVLASGKAGPIDSAEVIASYPTTTVYRVELAAGVAPDGPQSHLHPGR